MQNMDQGYIELLDKINNEQSNAYEHHKKMMKQLESMGFKSNPEPTVFPYNELLDFKPRNFNAYGIFKDSTVR